MNSITEWIMVITFVLCLFNYGLVLYLNKKNTGSYNLADSASVGWLMATLGWLNVVV